MTYSWQTMPDGTQHYVATLADGTTLDAGLYQTRRSASYPSAAEQIDAVWKILAALPAGSLANAPADALAVMISRDAVKTTYPKPDIPPPWVK